LVLGKDFNLVAFGSFYHVCTPQPCLAQKKTLLHYITTFINSPLIHNYIYLNIFILDHNSCIGMHEGKGILKNARQNKS
jgi:hypothetical protein